MRLLHKTLLISFIVLEAFLASCALLLKAKKKISQEDDVERETQALIDQEEVDFENRKKTP